MPTLPTPTTPYYGGGQVQNPADVIPTSGAPGTANIQHNLGTLAVDNATATIYGLASKSGGTANWITLGGGTSAVSTLTGNSGGAISPVAGNINLLGTTNEITTTGSGNTLTWSLSATLVAPGSLTVTSGFTVSAGAVTITTGTSDINISADAAATTINIGTGGAAKTLTLGSASSTSATTIQSGSGALNITSVNGAITMTSGTGTIGISTDAAATAINLGTGAGVKTVTVGSTNTTSITTVQSGSGGTSITSATAGLIGVSIAANSVAGTSLAINSRVGHATFTGQTTASADSVTVTVTNTLLTDTTQCVFVTADNLGSNDAQMTIQRVLLAVGSIAVTLKNNGAAALNGDIHVNFWLMN